MTQSKSKKPDLMRKIILYGTDQNGYIPELLKIIGFGTLSLLLGKIKFYMPGIEGSASDLREIALIIGIFYFRHWFSILLVSLITSLGTPPDGSILATFLMHFVALLAVYFIFRVFNKKIVNRIYFSALWILVGLGYFYLFLIPTMVVTYSYVGLIQEGELFSNYFKIVELIQFEVVSTTAVSALFLLNLKTTEVLEKKNRELLVSMHKSEESDKLKTAFLQNLSHEIRTPMNGILGFSRLLQSMNLKNGDIQKYTQQIIHSGDQLLNIVNDIIDASQLETKQVNVVLTENKVLDIIGEVIELFKLKSDLNNARIVINLNCPDDTKCYTDFYKATRSLYHLVDNALKFSNDMPVELDCTILNGMLEFSVKDYGIGIAENDRQIIFEGFMQLDNDLTRKYGGNGLGLTIAKGFIQSLNGNITMKSELGKGSVFYMVVPVNLQFTATNIA